MFFLFAVTVVCSTSSVGGGDPTYDLTVTKHCDDSTVPQTDVCGVDTHDPTCAKLYAAQEPGMPLPCGMKICNGAPLQGNDFISMQWGNAITIAVWVKVLSLYDDVGFSFVYQGTVGPDTYPLQQGIFSLNARSSDGETLTSIESYFGNSDCPLPSQTKAGCLAQSHAMLPIFLWQHWAFTFNGTHRLIYVNGETTGPIAFNPNPGPLSVSPLPLLVGATTLDPDQEEPTGVKIAGLRLYERVLPADEIESIANANASTKMIVPPAANRDILAYYDFSDFSEYGKNEAGKLCTQELEIFSISTNVLFRDQDSNITLTGIGFVANMKVTVGTANAVVMNVSTQGDHQVAVIRVVKDTLECGVQPVTTVVGACLSSPNVSVVSISTNLSIAPKSVFVAVGVDQTIKLTGACIGDVQAVCNINNTTSPAIDVMNHSLTCDVFITNVGTFTLAVSTSNTTPPVSFQPITLTTYGAPTVTGVSPQTFHDDAVPKVLHVSGYQFVDVSDLLCQCQLRNKLHRVSATFINSTSVACPGVCAQSTFAVPGNSIDVTVVQGPFNSTHSASMVVTSGAPSPTNSFADGDGLCVYNDCVAGRTYSFIVNVKDTFGYQTVTDLSSINVSCATFSTRSVDEYTDCSSRMQVTPINQSTYTVTYSLASAGDYEIGVAVAGSAIFQSPYTLTMTPACPSNCSNAGYCTDNGVCICFRGFMGVNCSITLAPSPSPTACPTSPSANHGDCYGKGINVDGVCYCKSGLGGSDCRWPIQDICIGLGAVCVITLLILIITCCKRKPTQSSALTATTRPNTTISRPYEYTPTSASSATLPSGPPVYHSLTLSDHLADDEKARGSTNGGDDDALLSLNTDN